MTRVAHAGVGGWGKNVARVVGELAELAWVVDRDEARQAVYAARYPQARVSGSFEDIDCALPVTRLTRTITGYTVLRSKNKPETSA